ncbi:MAG: hypothetical protein R2849_14100 [Thermomicrobiales bacterium]
MRALATEPNVAVIDSFAVPAEGNIGSAGDFFQLTGLKSSDEVFDPISAARSQRWKLVYDHDHRRDRQQDRQPQRALYESADDRCGRWGHDIHLVADLAERRRPVGGGCEEHRSRPCSPAASRLSSIRDDLRDQQKQESGFLYIIEGFMGLGLLSASQRSALSPSAQSLSGGSRSASCAPSASSAMASLPS